ncbi:MAG TPA: RAMP superfamily CRISPR-associated protein [Pseudonocardiaceae bacterium]|jgi:CRISPR/Cas system CSM-associated protein Csm3 (group 7 of RAMP superfamily)|nr:RAMP superfamily CRISPR-associated protein [Pseudonocardiaceae bacterium]
MAREVVVITRLTAEATTSSPLHVGGWGEAPGMDAALARNGQGQLVVPGTSLAGALRAALGQPWRPPPPDRVRRSRPPTAAERIWGAADVEAVGGSRVVVQDASVHLAPEAVARRDGVGIDRAWGSAMDQLLYGRELVPAGVTVVVELEVHSSAATEAADLALLARIAELLGSGLYRSVPGRPPRRWRTCRWPSRFPATLPGCGWCWRAPPSRARCAPGRS